jgi:Zn-dependent protease with chaperone function
MELLHTALRLGWFHLVVPLALFEIFFFAATVIGGVIVLGRCRRRLKAAGTATWWPTALIAPALLVVAPILVGWFVAAFSLNRSVASAIDEGSAALAERIQPAPPEGDEGLWHRIGRHATGLAEREAFQRTGDRFRSAAHASLTGALVSGLGLNGLCFGAVALGTRRRRSGDGVDSVA